ncbi:twocomponent response regulator [Bradyrhizobium sp.]|nr:response regulator [Bradyrhizobium sp.]CUT12686.1 twocomponent response regulator [Bradyrhizobium sp.]
MDVENVQVLLVEDEDLIIDMIKDALEDAGFAVTASASGEEALAAFDCGPRHCVLVTDINLGRNRMSGWEVARKVRESHPGIAVIYVTGDSAHGWPSQGVPHSVLIGKPFAPAQIVTAVAQAATSALQ